MDLHNVFLHAHRGFAYLILLIVALFIVSLLAVMFGYSGKINKLLRKSTLFTMIFFHTIFNWIGYVIFSSSFMSISKSKRNEHMKNADLRFTYIEHPFSMLVAAVLLTIANKKIKQNETI
jgi:Na+/proline symporter